MEYTKRCTDVYEHKNKYNWRHRKGVREWAKKYLKESSAELLQTSGKQIKKF